MVQGAKEARDELEHLFEADAASKVVELTPSTTRAAAARD
jgi:hypothetical protein